MISELGTLKDSGSAVMADPAQWRRPGTLTITDIGDRITAVGNGYFEPEVGVHNIHILPEWDITVQLDDTSATLTSDFSLGIGLKNMQGGVSNPVFDAMVWLDGITQQIYMHMPNEVFPASMIIPFASISYFNWTNATVKVSYANTCMDLLVTNPAGQYFSRRWRYNMLIRRPDGSIAPNTHQSNLLSSFAVKFAGTTVDCNKVKHIKVHSNTRMQPDFIGGADSISIARQNYPNTVGYLYKLQQKFQKVGQQRIVQVHAAGGLNTDRFRAALPSMLALQPKNMVILIGDNDDRNNVEAWKPKMTGLVNDALAGCTGIIYVMDMIPDTYDPHVPFHLWLIDPFGGLITTVTDASRVVIVPYMASMCVRGDIAEPDLSLADPADHTHWKEPAHEIAAKWLFAAIRNKEAGGNGHPIMI